MLRVIIALLLKASFPSPKWSNSLIKTKIYLTIKCHILIEVLLSAKNLSLRSNKYKRYHRKCLQPVWLRWNYLMLSSLQCSITIQYKLKHKLRRASYSHLRISRLSEQLAWSQIKEWTNQLIWASYHSKSLCCLKWRIKSDQ